MMPVQRGTRGDAISRAILFADHAQHRAHPVDLLDVAERVDRRPQVRLACLVRDQDQPGVVVDAPLLHRLDRHAVATELGRDRRQHARTVRDLHRQVELGADLVDRDDGLGRERPDDRALATLHDVLGRVDEVAEDRRRGRRAAGAAAVQHELADRVTFDEDRVERVAYRRQWMTGRHHGRVHSDRDPPVVLFRDGQQLHDVPQLGGGGDVVRRQRGDPFAVHVVGPDARAERDRRDDRSLRRGVEALDVGGGIRFREPQALSFRERVVERRTSVCHGGQDEVCGAVDDAEHPPDPVAGKRLAERTDERNAAADRRFEEDVDPRTLRRLEQLATVRGDELLVGGDDRLAPEQCLDDEGAGGLDAAHDLHDDVDVGITRDRHRVVGEAARADGQASVSTEIADRDARDFERNARPRFDDVGVLVDEAHERAPDVPASQDSDPNSILHHDAFCSISSRAARSSKVSRRTTTRARAFRTNSTGGRGTRL